MKKRPPDATLWMSGAEYSAQLPPLSLNLLVADTTRSADFYHDVFEAEVYYQDIDFAALRVGPAEVMLHADHAHEGHPWIADLAAGTPRGVGAQFRLLGIDPDALAERARTHGEPGALVAGGPVDREGRGWREVLVRDPDGYEWACGILIGAAKQIHEAAHAA